LIDQRRLAEYPARAEALNYLLAERYNQEPERVASLVLIGNAFAIVFVPLGLTLGLHPV